jgi:hypothetical protein
MRAILRHISSRPCLQELHTTLAAPSGSSILDLSQENSNQIQ